MEKIALAEIIKPPESMSREPIKKRVLRLPKNKASEVLMKKTIRKINIVSTILTLKRGVVSPSKKELIPSATENASNVLIFVSSKIIS